MLTLLYIDDSKADAELLRATLGPYGIHVVPVRSGTKGIAAYDPARHAAVLIDWNLSDMDGLKTAAALLEHHPDCSIGFVSGVFEPQHLAAASALGIHHCFEKSVSMDHIKHIGEFVHNTAAQSKRRVG